MAVLCGEDALVHRVAHAGFDDHLAVDPCDVVLDARLRRRHVGEVLLQLGALLLYGVLQVSLHLGDGLLCIDDVALLLVQLAVFDAQVVLASLQFIIFRDKIVLAGFQAIVFDDQIVSVYIDEVQAFLAGLPGSLADALAQARSLGAAFHLAHQYRGQLSTEMMHAVETNTRSKVYFALSATDAAAAARLAPELEADDFQLLAQYQAYATVMHHGHRSGWFFLATRPAPPAVRDPALLYAASHARYGIPAEQTEAELIALTSGGTPATVDTADSRSPATTLMDATAATTDVTCNRPGDGAAESTPGVPDEAGPDGISNGTKPGRRRPAIGRRRRP